MNLRFRVTAGGRAARRLCTVLLGPLLLYAAAPLPPAAAADRGIDPAREAIDTAREAKRERRRGGGAAPVPRGMVEVAATAERVWSGSHADALAALRRAAEQRSLRVVGPIDIPEGEFIRLRATPGGAQRVWLCAEGEAEMGPCLTSFTVHDLRQQPGLCRASFRIWALPGASAASLERAAEQAEAILASLGR